QRRGLPGDPKARGVALAANHSSNLVPTDRSRIAVRRLDEDFVGEVHSSGVELLPDRRREALERPVELRDIDETDEPRVAVLLRDGHKQGVRNDLARTERFGLRR